MVEDLTNKTISDVASDDSESSSLLPMLPPSNEEQQSHVRSSPTTANQTHAYREEYTFIQSEKNNEHQENKPC